MKVKVLRDSAILNQVKDIDAAASRCGDDESIVDDDVLGDDGVRS